MTEKSCACPCPRRPKSAAKKLLSTCTKSWKTTAPPFATSGETSRKPSTSWRRTKKSARTSTSAPMRSWKSSPTRKPRRLRISPARKRKKFWRSSKFPGLVEKRDEPVIPGSEATRNPGSICSPQRSLQPSRRHSPASSMLPNDRTTLRSGIHRAEPLNALEHLAALGVTNNSVSSRLLGLGWSCLWRCFCIGRRALRPFKREVLKFVVLHGAEERVVIAGARSGNFSQNKLDAPRGRQRGAVHCVLRRVSGVITLDRSARWGASSRSGRQMKHHLRLDFKQHAEFDRRGRQT